MKKGIIIITLLTIISCTTVNLSIGETYSIKNGMQKPEKIFLPNSTYANSIDVISKDIVFKIGLNKENKIIFITTNDLNFETNGFKINYTMGKEFNKKGKEQIQGWGQFILLDSGWYAAFDYKDTINENSKIKWFFKFDFSESNAKLKI